MRWRARWASSQLPRTRGETFAKNWRCGERARRARRKGQVAPGLFCEVDMENDCLFCRMASGAVPVAKVFEDETVFALNDINPRAPTHILLIPKEHIPSARELTEGHGALLAHLFTTAAAVAREAGLGDRGYRLTFNVGDEGGQTIYHLHLHLLGGRRMGAEG